VGAVVVALTAEEEARVAALVGDEAALDNCQEAWSEMAR